MRRLVLVGALLFSVAAHAESPYLHPALTISPKLPAPIDAIALTISDQTGVLANVVESSITQVGSEIEVRASIELGYTSILGFYTIQKALQSLPAGVYSVTYVARARRKDPDTEFTPYFTEGQWTFVVVGSSQIASAIEYFHAGFGHYFLTTNAEEIAALDSGHFGGWERTGQAISVFAPLAGVQGTSPVCRFYGRPEAGLNTHVYTANETECAILIGQPQSWILESPSAFAVVAIDLATDACPVNAVPVYRLWNGLSAPNHRHTTSKTIQAQMALQGWIPEGSGEPPAIWCALPSGTQ